jgi:hypothetical protein
VELTDDEWDALDPFDLLLRVEVFFLQVSLLILDVLFLSKNIKTLIGAGAFRQFVERQVILKGEVTKPRVNFLLSPLLRPFAP